MSAVPFATFSTQVPVDAESNRAALSAVGRCRVVPSCSAASQASYEAIVAKNKEQAVVDEKADKKLRKKLMKEGVAMAKTYLMDLLQLDVSVVNVEVVVGKDDVVQTDGCLAACLLDAGCSAIVMDGTDPAALDAAKIPRERLVAQFTAVDKDVMAAASPHAALISVVDDKVVGPDVTTLLQSMHELQLDAALDVQITPIGMDEEIAVTVGTAMKATGQSVSLVDPSASQLGLSCGAIMRTDRADGLYTTVVTTRGNEALGLVYSSKKSIVAALECGRGVYYTRSRGGLWRKGDTSGRYQTLHRLDVDCDGDALRFTVTQRGEDLAAFCHLDTLSCWGKTQGLRALESTLQDRLASAPEGSYTKRLFEDEELLRNKLVEEAQELSEAQEKQHVAEELADVLYFAMVRAVKAGVGWDEAIAELDRKARKVTRRKGDSKAFRIAAGDAILDGKKDGQQG